jgi:hypothetical protein
MRHDRLDRGRGKPKKIRMEVIKRDMSLLDIDESMTVISGRRRLMWMTTRSLVLVHVADPKFLGTIAYLFLLL